MNKKYIYALGAAVVIIIIAVSFSNRSNDLATQEENGAANNPSSANNTGSKPITTKPKPGTNTDLPKFITTASLEGSVYSLKSYNGAPVAPGSKYTLSFEKGTLNAKFCNSMSGPFVLDGGNLTVSNVASTKMFCTTPEGVMDMETKFSSSLPFGVNIYKTGNDITISSKDSVFVFTGFGN